MQYILDRNGNISGIDFTAPGDAAPIKPLFDSDTAIPDGDAVRYSFSDAAIQKPPEARAPCKEDCFSIFSTVCSCISPGCGDFIKPKEKEISVLIPCYGKAAFVRDAVSSAADQTLAPYEILVLLMDRESAALRENLEALSPSVRCIVRERLNPVAARNFLVQECRTEYFVFLDGDDTLKNNFLEAVYAEKESIVFPVRCDEGQAPQILGGGSVFQQAIMQNLTALLCKEAFDETGLDESLCFGGEDSDFILRLFCAGKWKVGYTYATCYFYRHEDENALTKMESFFDCHVKNLFKNRSRLLGEMRKVLFTRDRFFSFFEDDANFTDWQTASRAFSDKILDESRGATRLAEIGEAAKASRERNAESVFRAEDFDIPDGFPNPAVLEGRIFDAVVAGAITADTLDCARQIVIRRTLKERMEKECAGCGNYERLLWLFRNGSCFVYPMDIDVPEENPEILNQIVTFELNKECNRDCVYCTQARGRPYPHYDDDEIFSRFDRILTHLEKITGGRVMPQIMGGEPTIWSDALIRRILDRLSGYTRIAVVSNHDKKDSAWEECGRVVWYTHVVDWKTAGTLKLQANEMCMIVVCHGDVGALGDFMMKNAGCRIRIDEYIGEDESLKLTDEDRARIAALEQTYPQIDTQILSAYASRGTSVTDPEACRQSLNIWRADCTHMTVCPCCGRNQRLYPYEEFTGQLPCLAECTGCNVYNRF